MLPWCISLTLRWDFVVSELMCRLFKPVACVSLKMIWGKLRDKSSNRIPSYEPASLSPLLTFFALELLCLQMWGGVFELVCLSELKLTTKKKSFSSLSTYRFYRRLADICCSGSSLDAHHPSEFSRSWLWLFSELHTLYVWMYGTGAAQVTELELLWSSLKVALNTDAVGFFKLPGCLLLSFWSSQSTEICGTAELPI